MAASDFRSDPSESPEGKGTARRVWDAYVAGVNKAGRPLVEPMAMAYSRQRVGDLVGFWVLWHLYGGFDGLEQTYGMHRSTIWRKVAKFRKVFGAHPDEYRFEGITIDTPRFWNAALADAKVKAR